MPNTYPSWRYHATAAPRVIHSPEHEHPEWKDTPAAFIEPDSVWIEVVEEPTDDAYRARPVSGVDPFDIQPDPEPKPKKTRKK